MQKSVVFPHTNNGQSEQEMKKTLPFTTAAKRTKHLAIKSTRNEKTLLKEIENDTNKWKDIMFTERNT